MDDADREYVANVLTEDTTFSGADADARFHYHGIDTYSDFNGDVADLLEHNSFPDNLNRLNVGNDRLQYDADSQYATLKATNPEPERISLYTKEAGETIATLLE